MIRSLLGASVGAALIVLSAGAATDGPIATATLRRIATVDERYQSYNVEMAEVIGGNFWKPYDAETSSATTSPSQPLGAHQLRD